jgi:primosomal protein N' (replication factor Y)
MIEHVVNLGKQVIVLIPEIALTYQTVQRFYRRFGDKVSIINSRMSKGERYDQFQRAMKGEISIIIGPRSALFTPFNDIGLIVVDEEHEGSYKSELSPRYHARPVAIHIAETMNASVVLGSATPSVESFYRAKQGQYELLELEHRAAGALMPQVYTVDLRDELKSGNRSIFSRKLRELMEDRLRKKEQIMLFLNKRGFAGFISCRSCGHVFKCPHCDISLTYHKNGKLMCHYCGYEENSVKICPKCGSKYVSGFRAGTEQIEEILNREFISAKVLRMDMDTTKGKDGHEKILASFANHEADILVGTQMIVKGHDFPDVTLVGILAADMSLYGNDYASAERTYQLLVQASGRAGRAGKPGEVVIQSYTPEHYSIVTASANDYNTFYDEEIEYRKLLGYPPVQNMLKVAFSMKDVGRLETACEDMKRWSAEYVRKMNAADDDESLQSAESTADVSHICCNIQVAGPIPAGVYKVKDIYSQILCVKSPDYSELTRFRDCLEEYVRSSRVYDGIIVQYDFN